MNMKQLSLAIGILSLAASSYGDNYQFEASGSLGQVSIDFGGFGNSDIDTLTLGGKVHFASVKTSSNPLSEAAFLAKSNNIGLTHIKWNSETNFDIARMEIYIPRAMLYIAPFYLYSSDEFEGEKESSNDYGLSIGITPIDGLRVYTTWVDDIDYELNFDAKYVAKLNNSNAINVELSYAKAADDEFEDEDDQLGLAIDYFLDQTLSVGVEYLSASGFNSTFSDSRIIVGEDSYGLRGEKYFSDSLSVFAKYLTSDTIDSWVIGTSLRF